MSAALTFELPEWLEAHSPPEERGLSRDEVRMLVARRSDCRLTHARFRELPDFLSPGDLVVINTSKTLPAAIPATRADGECLTLHLSTPLPGGHRNQWVVELRQGEAPFGGGYAGELVDLPARGHAHLIARYVSGARLWVARLDLPEPLLPYLANHGKAIRYGYAHGEFPLASYQTVYAGEPGSAEMPSAGRPFTSELVTALVAAGVAVAPVVVHTGVSSPEVGEPPYAERFRVPAPTARLVNATHSGGGRVIAVGTTVVRALETAAGPDGSLEAGEGWTTLVVTPEQGVRTVDGLLTGWHEPRASHLLMLQAVAGSKLVERSYHCALGAGYLWHEFGDVHLILP